MKVRIGCTRIVVLVGDRAIKIARIRVLRPFLRIPFLVCSGSRRRRYMEKYGPGILAAVARDILAGLTSNRNESSYYGSADDRRPAPVKRTLLFGAVIVQARGGEASAEEVRASRCADIAAHDPESRSAKQYCRIGDEVFLVDYGSRETIAYLRATA
jgi:hypothetical protein